MEYKIDDIILKGKRKDKLTPIGKELTKYDNTRTKYYFGIRGACCSYVVPLEKQVINIIQYTGLAGYYAGHYKANIIDLKILKSPKVNSWVYGRRTSNSELIYGKLIKKSKTFSLVEVKFEGEIEVQTTSLFKEEGLY